MSDVPCGKCSGLVRFRTLLVDYERQASKADAEIGRLTTWVNDLQSGMYVNCVYCGHQYGPGETTPVTMADALKAHVEQCPKHPMSALRLQLAAMSRDILESHTKMLAQEERERRLREALVGARQVMAHGYDDDAVAAMLVAVDAALASPQEPRG